MKENGMEKLLDLLNEYDKNHHNKSDLYYLFEIEDGMLFCYDDVTDVQRTMQDEAMVICSKKFGFIKWLVDNDKIDRTYRKDLKYPYYIDDKERDLKGYEKSDLLLMLLSIQESPIELLISILK